MHKVLVGTYRLSVITRAVAANDGHELPHRRDHTFFQENSPWLAKLHLHRQFLQLKMVATPVID